MSVMAVPPAPPPDPWLFPTPGPAGFATADLADLPDDGTHYELADGVLLATRPGGLTVADLDRIPGGDGNSYELVDGMLVVSPAPTVAHQFVAARLTALLTAACPADLFVFGASPAVQKGRRSSVEPDVTVARMADLRLDGPYTGVPVLVVEVLSPSSVALDRVVKRSVYAQLGVPFYWIVDPSPPRGPAVTVLRLDTDGGYRKDVIAGPHDTVAVQDPFPVAFRPADLRERG